VVVERSGITYLSLRLVLVLGLSTAVYCVATYEILTGKCVETGRHKTDTLSVVILQSRLYYNTARPAQPINLIEAVATMAE
jgi:hypothetical protein